MIGSAFTTFRWGKVAVPIRPSVCPLCRNKDAFLDISKSGDILWCPWYEHYPHGAIASLNRETGWWILRDRWDS